MAFPTDERAKAGYLRMLKQLEGASGKSPRAYLAERLGVERGRPYMWKAIPVQYLVQACRLANMPAWQIRPDIFSYKEFMEIARMENIE